MTVCVYCNRDMPNMAREHVIPQGIGGNLRPTNPFVLDEVCSRCNSVAGTYIDGPFIRSWFTQNHRADNAKRYVRLETNPVFPLTYMGVLNGFAQDTRICEFWLGPTGDTIYHFHEPYPEEPDVGPMVGPPTFARPDDVDPGFVFLFVRASNPVWHQTICMSVIDHFRGSALYLGNGAPVEPFLPIPPHLQRCMANFRPSPGPNTMSGLRCQLITGIGSWPRSP